jgi:dTDP-4-amino-4,6-dideoxy-D-galactose acyltransferase
MHKTHPCQLLPWDSNFFGFRIARVNSTQLSKQKIEKILEWCQQNQIECLYFLADSDHPRTVYLAENHGFRFVDIRMTLQAIIPEPKPTGVPSAIIRNYYPSDLPDLVNIARSSFRRSRFYADPRFSPEACDLLYETWVKKECNTNPEGVFVAEKDNQIIGFITCQLSRERYMGSIGLIGVAGPSRGLGIGQSLIEHAVQWAHDHGTKQIEVITQGRNTQALRLYERVGFLTQHVQVWYHKWFNQ